MIPAARLSYRCMFQKQVKVADGGGGFDITWPTQFTAAGGFSFPRLRSRMEAIAAGAVQTVNSAELVVRDAVATRRVTKDWRVVVPMDLNVSPADEQVWNIRKVYPRSRDGFIRFEVESGVPT